MSVHVIIETASKADAELIASTLQPSPRVESWRGYGIIRLGSRSKSETAELMDAVAEGVERHALAWARVRYDDDERIFRGNGRNGHQAH
jgi:hypothetical protein